MANNGITVRTDSAGALTRAPNESGWLEDEVIAAGHCRQGKAPSLAATITGTALIQVLRPRRSKLLPRQFVLAATADRLVALKPSGSATARRPTSTTTTSSGSSPARRPLSPGPR